MFIRSGMQWSSGFISAKFRSKLSAWSTFNSKSPCTLLRSLCFKCDKSQGIPLYSYHMPDCSHSNCWPFGIATCTLSTGFDSNWNKDRVPEVELEQPTCWLNTPGRQLTQRWKRTLNSESKVKLIPKFNFNKDIDYALPWEWVDVIHRL